MKTIILVGSNGLVGSALSSYFNHHKLEYLSVNRANQEMVRGRDCDLLVLAMANSNKTRANQDPTFDLRSSVLSVYEYINATNARKVVLISSVDVYPEGHLVSRTKERPILTITGQSTYGFHKQLAEIATMRLAKDWCIFRLPAIVGPGLKKNPIFDYFSDQKMFISPDSELNVVHTSFIARVVTEIMLDDKLSTKQIFNVVAKDSLVLNKLEQHFGLKKNYHPEALVKKQIYNISSTKLSKLYCLPSSIDAVKLYFSDRQKWLGKTEN
jgi:nucleoside-diphosphate-sugar epimerase